MGTRRDFIKTLVGASMVSGSAYYINSGNDNPKVPKTDGTKKIKESSRDQQEKLSSAKQGMIGNALVKALEKINPTLVNAIVGSRVWYKTYDSIINNNLSKFAEGELDKNKLIYNNSDKYAGILIGIPTLFIPYLIRAATVDFNPWNQVEGKQAKEQSDISNMNSYYIENLLYVHFYNPAQASLRQVFMDMLHKNSDYDNDPRKISISDFRKELIQRRAAAKTKTKEDPDTMGALQRVVKYFSIQRETNEEIKLPYAVARDLRTCTSPRGIVDLLLVALSYKTVQKTNFSLAQAVATPTRLAWFTRDMLERLPLQGHGQAEIDEELQSGMAHNISQTASSTLTAMGQGLIEHGFKLAGKSTSSSLALTNAREMGMNALNWVLLGKFHGPAEEHWTRPWIENNKDNPFIQTYIKYVDANKVD